MIRNGLLFAAMAAALILVGLFQSWNVALAILNLQLISAVMALGTNMQWGYAGLINVGIMGFAAVGGIAAVLVSMPPVPEAWRAGGAGVLLAGLALAATVAVTVLARSRLEGRAKMLATLLVVAVGYFVIRRFYDPAVDAIEAVDSARTGYLGGLGLPILLGWLAGGVAAAGVAWVIGKVALGLRSDYLAIATLGISEIIIAILKNEDWLSRGVKNVTGLPRPVPYEVQLQREAWFQDLAARWGQQPELFSGVTVKALYAVLFLIVLLAVYALAQRALASPWGRMMRAIRDNRDAAAAMGKNVKRRHLQVFVLGSAVVGIGGAMLTTLDGQFTPGSYQPLRYTFLIWVMVIVGGSGNNTGSILGAFVVWFVWVEAEPAGILLMEAVSAVLPRGSALSAQLMDAAPHLRLFLMGLILLVVLRFSPRGLIPEPRR
ncbi:branched-chain amino acid ABC transporter permease [Rhodobacteraceae bacterium 2CG4]|uniref:Branched-chain amino acid ABC transporter permease n=1 Tax=Halovulum marinum TaxID=2662447 RepID=A0A6L5YVE5_9RHOB|nr:branched-chain amino acid ABC transporter permease [Halovulum marinum]MSU88323.1 branched-chain amino acid ABC transporter permease [Halovulum marinum]